MDNNQYIQLEVICTNYKIEPSFIESLCEFGLLELYEEEDGRFVDPVHLTDLERMIRLHYDLGVNMEGLDTIWHLLERIESLQQELVELKNIRSSF